MIVSGRVWLCVVVSGCGWFCEVAVVSVCRLWEFVQLLHMTTNNHPAINNQPAHNQPNSLPSQNIHPTAPSLHSRHPESILEVM